MNSDILRMAIYESKSLEFTFFKCNYVTIKKQDQCAMNEKPAHGKFKQ